MGRGGNTQAQAASRSAAKTRGGSATVSPLQGNRVNHVNLLQTQTQLDLFHSICERVSIDEPRVLLYSQEEWDAADETGRQTLDQRINDADALHKRGLLVKNYSLSGHGIGGVGLSLSHRGRYLQSEGVPASLPALTHAEAMCLVTDRHSSYAFDGSGLVTDLELGYDDEISYSQVESAAENGYESGIETALEWARDVFSRVA